MKVKQTASAILMAFALLASSACETIEGVEGGADGLELLWKRPLGMGYSRLTDAGEGGLITLMHADNRDIVVSIDIESGDERWRASYPESFEGDGYGPGPHATPVIAGERVLAMGAGGKLSCLQLETGELLWQHDFLTEFGGEGPGHGYAASPVVFDGAVIAAVGGPGIGAAAFELSDGSLRWKANDFLVSYCSPTLLEFAGETLVLFNNKRALVALDPRDGVERWRLAQRNGPVHNLSMPPLRCDDDLLWTSTRSQSDDSGSFAYRLSAEGLEPLYWDRRSKVEPYANAVTGGGKVYACMGTGRAARLVALDPRTGEAFWEQRGYRAANVAWAGAELVVLGDEGLLVVGTPTEVGFEERCRAVLASDRTWTQPTVVGERIFVRDRESVWCYRLAPSASRAAPGRAD